MLVGVDLEREVVEVPAGERPGALAEIGLPTAARVPALLGFNMGLEIAQLAVVLVAWPLFRTIERRSPRSRAATRIALAYAIGALAFMWLLDRILQA